MRVVAALAAAAVVGGAAVPAASAPFLIVSDKVVGGVRMTATLPQARAVLGTPNTKRRVTSSECRAVWRPLGLTLTFLDLSSGAPCAKGGAVVAVATAAEWHTRKGLKVGDPVARLRVLYPGARFFRGAPYQGWWLITRHTCAEVGSQPYPGLLARTAHRKVAAFVVTVAPCE
jgi:hypothetical protein